MGDLATAERATGARPNWWARPAEYLTFKLGAEEYGIEILKVQEIRGYERPTRIANAPAFVKGVINLRGVIVPIIDLRARLELDEPTYDAFTVVIVLSLGARTVGAVVDAVSDVVELKAEQIKPPPELATAQQAGFITGIGTVKQGNDERMTILLDIDLLMADASLALTELTVQ
jgi:purine-binding chemotaxis protein CheW